MRRTLPLLLIAVSCALSQQDSPPPPGLVETTPDTVIAVLNGRKFTVGDLEKLLPVLQPSMQRLVATQPKAAMQELAAVEVMVQEAEKLNLEKDPKVQQQVAHARQQILSQALVQKKSADTMIPDEELRKEYTERLGMMREAQVRIVFVSRGNLTQNLESGEVRKKDPEELKKRAEEVAKLARSGKDFAALATEYSDDKETSGNGGILNLKIRANMMAIPKEMTDAILKAEKGDIIGPMEHGTGWYVFRVETIGVPDFEAVRPEIEKQLKDARIRGWFEQLRAKSSVQMENDAFWDTFVATNTKDGAARQEGAK